MVPASVTRVAKDPKSETLVERLEREFRALRGVFRRSRVAGLFIAFLLLGYAAFVARDIWIPSAAAPTANSQAATTISMSCRPETFPIEVTQGAKIYGVQLHPQWGNVIQVPVRRTDQPNARSVWPDLRTNNVGYQCQIVNDGTEELSGLSVQLRVKFFAASASPRNRLVDVPIRLPVEARGEFMFYIADDSGWLPEVTLPERIRGRIGSATDVRDIPVRYASSDGMPPSLNGFGVNTP
jgi:hypothetical protein